jgi:polyhydroxyalkanoate synthesis regulator phasin
MAKGNMIVTLVAQTKKFQDGLRDAGGAAVGFGKIVGGAMNLAFGAITALVGAVIFFLPNFIKMGEEARKSELRLGNVAKQMGLFGDETEKVTGRISKYAETLSFLTGVDDELTRENQAVLLTFSELAKSANKVGGPFDRATKALLDLEAAGKDLKAVALGKALQDPLNNMTALRKAGILLTEEQQKQIESFMKANDVISAQDVLLKAIESQVGGTAEAIASSTDKMSARFESVVEELSLALLPAVDDISQAMIDWLDSVEGKQAIQKLTDELVKFGEWIASPDGKQAIDDLVYSLKIMADTLSALVGFIKAAADGWQELVDTTRQKVVLPIMERFGAYTPPGTRSTNGAYPGAGPAQAPITVNVNGVVSGPATSRTVLDAVKEANRLGMR